MVPSWQHTQERQNQKISNMKDLSLESRGFFKKAVGVQNELLRNA
jgi:hypothetical protein